ncbi:MAG TPA: hypothetical protein VJG29_01500 [Candidatus Paceibacterota bacterium]
MDKTTKQLATWGGAGILLVTGGLFGVARLNELPGELDEFAACLTEQGVTFYGAFWCPNCTNQKKMFGRSADLLPYLECSTSDGKGQLPVCAEKAVTGYPTWEFADGTRLNGTQPLRTLADKTNCALPE